MSNPNTPTIIGAISGTTVVVTKAFGTRIGALYLINSNTNPVWVTYDGTDPVASDGVGRVSIPTGIALNLENIDCGTLKAISTGAFTLQYVAMQRGS